VGRWPSESALGGRALNRGHFRRLFSLKYPLAQFARCQTITYIRTPEPISGGRRAPVLRSGFAEALRPKFGRRWWTALATHATVTTTTTTTTTTTPSLQIDVTSGQMLFFPGFFFMPDLHAKL